MWTDSREWTQVSLAALLMLALGSTAQAVDGAIEINQTKALAGGVTGGDAAGFPVTIDTPGNYVLTGNLSVGNSNDDAIQVAAEDVTIDLNGFRIEATTTCTGLGSSLSCTPTGAAVGVAGSPFEIRDGLKIVPLHKRQ